MAILKVGLSQKDPDLSLHSTSPQLCDLEELTESTQIPHWKNRNDKISTSHCCGGKKKKEIHEKLLAQYLAGVILNEGILIIIMAVWVIV